MNEEIKNEVVENETTEETQEEKVSMNPKDYTIIRDMIKEMEEWNKMLQDETHSILKNSYGLTNFAIVGIIPYSDEKIESMSMDDVKSFIEKYKDHNVDNVPVLETLEDAINFMKEIKDLQMNLYSAEQETSKLKEESKDILNEYLNYLSSPEIVEARRNRLANMKALAESETDVVKKARMMDMINSMEQTDTMEFIFKRFNDDVAKESKSVLEAYFDERKGSYVIDRYKKKINKFGFETDIYKYFFNIEENFLPEKYHVFNNLFLFYYMRFIAYANPDNKTDKLFVQTLTSSLANTIYHKFNSTIEEQKFLNIIERFEDYFTDKYDYFMENNTTRPGHPVREQANAKYEADRKARLIAKMNEMNITGYDENMTSRELQEYFNNTIEKMLDEQKQDRDSKNIKVTEEEDGSTRIEPNMGGDEETVEESIFVTGLCIKEEANTEIPESVTTVASIEE